MRDSQHNLAIDWALLSVRVVVGIIFIAHGMQKVFGFFDGPGLENTVKGMGPIGYFVSFGELLGGLGLLVGLLSRFSAASNIVIMVGAIAMVHGKNGFFLQNSGFEYNLALIGLLLPVLIAGPGLFSLSAALARALPKGASGKPRGTLGKLVRG